MSRFSPLLCVVALSIGCNDASIFLSPDVPIGPLRVDPALCGFEANDLAGFGRPGESFYEPEEGGKVSIVGEGWDFSGLIGEEALTFHGERALLIRSNDAGDPASWGVVTTEPFLPAGEFFVLDQLSEVGPDGIELELRILEDPSGEVLDSFDVPADTGGYIPQLAEVHGRIPEFPEITHAPSRPGTFVRRTFDLSEWRDADQSIRVQVRQHTRIEGNGFFTLLDNLCDGEPLDPDPE